MLRRSGWDMMTEGSQIGLGRVQLSTWKERDRKKHASACRDVRKAVSSAKDAWFQRKALEAERGRHSGKLVWSCIRDIQRGRRGLVPVRSAMVKDDDGKVCNTLEAQGEQWRKHFTKILNIHNEFNEEELERVRQRPLRSDLAELPSEDEVWNAVGKLRSGKAGGGSGILLEMVKVACSEEIFMSKLLELVHDVWRECSVPGDWRDAILVPIPKKGDLSSCDNWHGISLLDVVRKVVARVLLQVRLQKLAEEELSESQCEFRKGRSCTDMIFTVRQLVEKSWEHHSKVFLTFIDLKKAYDSVLRGGLWLTLRKLGVLEVTINLIKSFHLGMKAAIRLEGTLLKEIDVENGLRQGCCMAPVLFNLYTCLVVEKWLFRVEGAGVGVTVKHKYDEKLFRRYVRNASERRITEYQFADNSALLASTRSGAERSALGYQKTASDFGLRVSLPKTKQMVTGRLVEEGDQESVALDGGDIEVVSEFPYLGSLIADSGRMDMDVDRQVAQASKAFGALRKSVFLDKSLSLATKRRLYNACVLSVLLYGSECWIPLRKHEKKMNSFHYRCVRTILGISNRQQWSECITMQEVRRR